MQPTVAPQRDRLPFLAALLSAATLAGVFGVGSVLWFLWHFGRDAARTWEEMGWWGPLTALVTALAVLLSMGALAARGWKPRLPAAVFLALGLLPWLVGAQGTRWGVRMCAEAVANVNPADKAIITMNGFEEALGSYLFGGGLSVVLLLGIALGLGTAALIVSSGRRKRAEGGAATEVGPAATAALLCLAAALAVVSCLPSASIHRSVLSAMANVNPADRALLLADAAAQLGPARGLARLALGMALALGVGTALWTWRRAGLGVGRALAAALCVVPAFAVHGLVLHDMRTAAQATAERPWDALQDFQPATLRGPSGSWQVMMALVTRTHLVPAKGGEVPLEGALAPALRELMDPDRLRFALSEDELREPELQPMLGLAVDGRLDGVKLRGLLEAARTAGAHSLSFVGQAPPSPARALFASEPLLAPFLQEMRYTELVALRSALPRDYPADHPEGWQGHLRGGARELTLTPRPDSGGEPVTVDLARLPPEDEPSHDTWRAVPVYLVVEEDVTAEQLVRAVDALSRQGIARRPVMPVLVTAPLPEFAQPAANDGPR